MSKQPDPPLTEVGRADLAPAQIVAELDRYVVGQSKAKRALAVALRNRSRRRRLDTPMSREVQPRNLILIGPTGVGKTELARRLAGLSGAPFLKVEASRFTEVGYVGRDVESMIDELAENAVQMVRRRRLSEVEKRAERNAEERLLDLLVLPLRKRKKSKRHRPKGKDSKKIREKLRRQLRSGKLDQRSVELEIPERLLAGSEGLGRQLGEFEVELMDLLEGLVVQPSTHQMRVGEAIPYLILQEEAKLVDMNQVVKAALELVQENGIVFLDELDKIAGRESGRGPQVSREGVQRNLLPLLEGTTVNTRYGPVRTDHILFIAAGAFHVARPADLIPELQGRFPVRVEMDTLSEEDLIQILTEPESSLIRQYQALLQSDGIELRFTPEALARIAQLAHRVNQATENIGARRLHTIMETLLEEIAFLGSGGENREFAVDAEYVDARLAELVKNEDLSRYIL